MYFDPLRYAYPSRRNLVYARRGMASSTQPLASQTGIAIMEQGGTAIDAALAMAMLMPLVEPTGNGLGSDCFALIWTKGQLYGINGSGFSPRSLSAEQVRAAGYKEVPMHGWFPVMLPGAPAAWAEIHRRFGTLPLSTLAAPAIRYAREGFPLSVNVARQWGSSTRRFTALAREADGAAFRPWVEAFSKNAQPYRAGEIFQLPDYADTMEELVRTDCESFYRGQLMEKILAFSQQTGGFFTEEDFHSYRPEWVEPLSVRYKGYDVFELPPNGHGITALLALNILKGMELPEEKESVETYHRMIEAMKLAFVDARAYVADPRAMQITAEQLLDEDYAARRRALIGESALDPVAGDPRSGDTVYLATADGEGNMVSFIQSNYAGFGSGIVVPGTGISLQDRGAGFSLDPASPNVLAGGKRAYHTIIPGFLCRDGQPIGPFGVMGGFMQPQGHLQVVVNSIDYAMNPQECLDAPRFQWQGGRKIQLERGVPEHIASALAARGHQIEIVNSGAGMGRGQIIWRLPDGTLAGGTEARADGSIAVC